MSSLNRRFFFLSLLRMRHRQSGDKINKNGSVEAKGRLLRGRQLAGSHLEVSKR